MSTGSPPSPEAASAPLAKWKQLVILAVLLAGVGGVFWVIRPSPQPCTTANFYSLAAGRGNGQQAGVCILVGTVDAARDDERTELVRAGVVWDTPLAMFVLTDAFGRLPIYHPLSMPAPTVGSRVKVNGRVLRQRDEHQIGRPRVLAEQIERNP